MLLLPLNVYILNSNLNLFQYFSQMKFVEEGISRHSEKYERPNAASIQKRFRHFMKKYSRKGRNVKTDVNQSDRAPALEPTP